MLKRIALLAVVMALVSLIAGCSEADVAALDQPADGAVEVAPLETPTPSAVDPSELLTPADVEQVSGLSGLSVADYDPAVGAGGDVNIADESGQLVAMLVVDGPETWDAWLTDGFTVRESVTPPIGDESFIGPSPDVSEAVYIFGFIKGDVAIAIDTYLDPAGNGTILSTEELRALAEIVASRL